MSFETFAGWLVAVVAGYLGIGLLVAVPFVVRGIGRIDPAARGASWGFRLIVIPGVAIFWPLLLSRWWRGTLPPLERNAHRDHARERG